MKVISVDSGNTPVTNAEVLEWLKEKEYDVVGDKLASTRITPPRNTVSITRDVRKYIETSPAALVTPEALKLLFAKLAKFKLSGPELLMIANLRPEAYAHLTPLIYDVYTRFDETQLTEIIEAVNATLGPKTRNGVAVPGSEGAANQTTDPPAKKAHPETQPAQDVQMGNQPSQQHTSAEPILQVSTPALDASVADVSGQAGPPPPCESSHKPAEVILQVSTPALDASVADVSGQAAPPPPPLRENNAAVTQNEQDGSDAAALAKNELAYVETIPASMFAKAPSGEMGPAPQQKTRVLIDIDDIDDDENASEDDANRASQPDKSSAERDAAPHAAAVTNAPAEASGHQEGATCQAEEAGRAADKEGDTESAIKTLQKDIFATAATSASPLDATMTELSAMSVCDGAQAPAVQGTTDVAQKTNTANTTMADVPAQESDAAVQALTAKPKLTLEVKVEGRKATAQGQQANRKPHPKQREPLKGETTDISGLPK